jgi:hypothetical protein
VWVTQYDRDTGKRSYQFKADFYDNQPDGTVRVTRPMIEFFLSDGQVVHVEADDGVLRVAPGADRNTITGVPVEPPRYGTLKDNVKVQLYASAADQAREDPAATLTTTNVQFDNDTFRLFTQEYVDADGHTVHADDVPVTIRAKQYSFDGSGLVMFWDEMTRRLKSLDIAHGKQLIIYDTSGFSMTPGEGSSGPAAAADDPAPGGVVLADVEPGGAVAPAAMAPRNRYLATFYENVVVWQENRPLVTAAEMQVDFLPRGQSGDETESAPAAPPAAAAGTAPPAAEQSAPATEASPAAQEPIVVTWSGKMHMVPTDESKAEPLESGQSILTLTGTPVRLHRVSPVDGIESDAVGTKLVYHTQDSSARLTGDIANPMVVSQKHENGTVSTITGSSLLYSRLDQIAVIEGQGKAHLPDPSDVNSSIDASWDKNCIVHLTGGDQKSPEIKSAELAGSVTVDHPRFDLTADDLGLVFDAPEGDETSRQLKKVRATGNAVCVVHETDQKARTLGGQELQLFTARDPDGRLYPKTILADGSAEATQDHDNLTAEHLAISLAPKPPPEHKEMGEDQTGEEGDVQLEELDATDSVHVQGANDSSAMGDSLKIVMVNAHPQITLVGKPAYAKEKDSVLTAGVIRLSAEDQISKVVGPGELETAVGESAPGAAAADAGAADATPAKPRPMKITWTQSATLDGSANQIDVLGDVNAQSVSADGLTVDSAHSSELVAALAPTAAAKTMVRGAQSDFSFMQDKQLQSVSLRTKASVKSTLTDASGKLVRQYYIRSNRIDYDMVARRMSVPMPGQMLVEDLRPAATAEEGQSSPGGRGYTAFQWGEEMVYDEKARLADLQGDVTIRHWDAGEKPKAMSLRADTVQAEFQPIDQSDDAEVAQENPPLEISHMTAEHHVEVDTTSGPLRCGIADYDPVKQILVCRAGDEGAVTIVDGSGNAQASFKEVRLNLQNNTMEQR